jgi:ABC-type antimicrobial peptide transport system permease subunit
MRVREIDIQMAFGADRSRLAPSVMWRALRPLLIGGAVGLAASGGLARAIRSPLFGMSSTDPASYAASAVFVLVVGAVAALLPAVRALSVDPARAASRLSPARGSVA